MKLRLQIYLVFAVIQNHAIPLFASVYFNLPENTAPPLSFAVLIRPRALETSTLAPASGTNTMWRSKSISNGFYTVGTLITSRTHRLTGECGLYFKGTFRFCKNIQRLMGNPTMMLGDCQRVNKCVGLQLCPVFMVTAVDNQQSPEVPGGCRSWHTALV